MPGGHPNSPKSWSLARGYGVLPSCLMHSAEPTIGDQSHFKNAPFRPFTGPGFSALCKILDRIHWSSEPEQVRTDDTEGTFVLVVVPDARDRERWGGFIGM